MYTARIEQAYPPDGTFIPFGGDRVHVLERGQPDGPAVLMVHGASANAREFDASLVPFMDGDFRLLLADRPGHGHSGAPAGLETLGVQAAAMAAVIEALAPARKAVVVGHSYGGAVALRLALDRPELVEGLVLAAPVSHAWGGGGIAWYNYWATAPVIGPVFSWLVPMVGPRQAAAGMADTFAPAQVPPSYAEMSGLGLLFRPRAFRTNARMVLALEAELEAQSARYGELALPITVFSGEKDTVIRPPLHVYRLAKQAANVEVVSLPEIGHMPHHTHGAEIAAAVARLAGAPATP